MRCLRRGRTRAPQDSKTCGHSQGHTIGSRVTYGKGYALPIDYARRAKGTASEEAAAAAVRVVCDPEAEELAGVFTFQKPVSQVDDLTKNLNQLASVPGARILGLTFVKTPYSLWFSLYSPIT